MPRSPSRFARFQARRHQLDAARSCRPLRGRERDQNGGVHGKPRQSRGDRTRARARLDRFGMPGRSVRHGAAQDARRRTCLIHGFKGHLMAISILAPDAARACRRAGRRTHNSPRAQGLFGPVRARLHQVAPVQRGYVLRQALRSPRDRAGNGSRPSPAWSARCSPISNACAGCATTRAGSGP